MWETVTDEVLGRKKMYLMRCNNYVHIRVPLVRGGTRMIRMPTTYPYNTIIIHIFMTELDLYLFFLYLLLHSCGFRAQKYMKKKL